jgi:predicted metalloprotease with PDZ domain
MAVTSEEQLSEILGRRKAGDKVSLTIRRRGAPLDLVVMVEEDPRLEVVPVERIGRALPPVQRAFRDAWLGTKQ